MMPWCLTKNNVILTNSGVKRISSLKESDKVFNKNYKYKAINKIAVRELLDDEYILSIKVNSSGIKSEVTNNHKLHVVENNKLILKKASDLKVGDYLYTPKPITNNTTSILDMKKYITKDIWEVNNGRITYKRDISASTGIKEYIDIDEDAFYMAGLYLAEGCVYKSNDCVSFSFSGDEINTLAKRCKKCIENVFGIDPVHFYEREYSDRNGYELIVNNTLIGKFFKDQFGTGAEDKYILDCWRLNSNVNNRKALLRGYWDGDGHVSYRHSDINPECVSTTKSIEISLGLRDVLLSLDIVPSITKNIRKDGRVSYITSVSSSIFDDILCIYNTDRKPIDFYNYKVLEGFALRITGIEEVFDYTGPIYSISVDTDDDETDGTGGSYILNGVASSNSPWYRGDQCWAEPNIIHGAKLMRQIYENREVAKAKGKKLQSYIYDNFSWEHIADKIIKELEEI